MTRDQRWAKGAQWERRRSSPTTPKGSWLGGGWNRLAGLIAAATTLVCQGVTLVLAFVYHWREQPVVEHEYAPREDVDPRNLY